MTRIKFCGLTRKEEIEAVNQLRPDYIGFVFAAGSRRCITADQAEEMKKRLLPGIQAVGVFVNETPVRIAELLNRGVIDLAQLHGNEGDAEIQALRQLTDRPLVQAFQIRKAENLKTAAASAADYILLDSGCGSGKVFDWNLLHETERPYFLAGGLCAENVGMAVRTLHPYAVDVSSGIENGGIKDRKKMAAFLEAVRKEIS